MLLCTGCAPAADPAEEALAYAEQWFGQAAAGARGEHLCHALGLLKHAQFTCDELLEHAARIEPASRELTQARPRECMAEVCGEFFELTFHSRERAGQNIAEREEAEESEEIVVLKKDNGQYRLYWYRSASLMALLTPRHHNPAEAEKSPEQAAYDELTQRYPGLYSWPPCENVRVSSSNLMTDLMPRDNLNTAQMETLAAACGDHFCFGFIGNKVAAVCPHNKGES